MRDNFVRPVTKRALTIIECGNFISTVGPISLNLQTFEYVYLPTRATPPVTLDNLGAVEVILRRLFFWFRK